MRRDAGDLVARAIEIAGLGCRADLLDELRKHLIVIGVVRHYADAVIGPPVEQRLDAAMHGARRVEGVTEQSRPRRLRELLVLIPLMEARQAEKQRLVRLPVEANVETDIALRLEIGVGADLPLLIDEELAGIGRPIAARARGNASAGRASHAMSPTPPARSSNRSC